MKSNLSIYSINIVSLLLLTACSQSAGPSPTQNGQLKTVSPTGGGDKKRKGYLQRSYDKWEKEEWEPKTRTEASQEAETAQKKRLTTPSSVQKEQHAPAASQERNAPKGTTLQSYVDKWKRYLNKEEKEEKSDTKPSHVETLDAMPAIGDGER